MIDSSGIVQDIKFSQPNVRTAKNTDNMLVMVAPSLIATLI